MCLKSSLLAPVRQVEPPGMLQIVISIEAAGGYSTLLRPRRLASSETCAASMPPVR